MRTGVKHGLRNFIVGTLGLMVLAGAGCDRPPAASAKGVETLDSAGVRITFSAGPSDGADSWSINPVPVVTIGEPTAQDPRYEFYRIWTADIDRHGRIWIVDGASNEIRAFDRRGSFLFAHGGAGSGPGEFREGPVIRVVGDTILAWDAGLRRLTWLRTDGAVQRTLPVRDQLGDLVSYSGSNLAWQLTATGELLVTGYQVLAPVDPHGAGGTWTFKSSYALVSPGEERIQRLPFVHEDVRIRTAARVMVSNPFDPLVRPALDPATGHVFAADDGSWEIREYEPAATLRAIIRAAIPAVPVDDELWEEVYEKWSDRAEEAGVHRDAFRSELHAFDAPDSISALIGLTVSRDGFIWAARGVRSDVHTTVDRFEIFDSTGVWRGSLEAPRNLGRVLAIGDSTMLVLARDTLGVERVELYSISRPER